VAIALPERDAYLLRREYFDAVASVDLNIGRPMDALAPTGKAENTLVILTSYKGLSTGHNGIWRKSKGRWILVHNQGDRRSMYDNSLRLPLIVRWPGVIRPTRTIAETGSYFDWYPTRLEAAGAPCAAPHLRGRSLLPLQNAAKLCFYRTPGGSASATSAMVAWTSSTDRAMTPTSTTI
jgi:uncharacterized sulfatase